MIKIGILGLDTSHAPTFTHILNDPAHPHHIPGAKVVAAFPGGSPDIDISRNRLQKFTDQLRNQFQIPILDSPEQVAESCDLLFILSVDGRVHLDLFRRTAKFRRPTFIDKPLATTSADAREIFRLAQSHNIPLLSCSSLRFDDQVIAALRNPAPGPVIHLDIFGPFMELPEPPGLFYYGIHAIELMATILGPNPSHLQTLATPNTNILTFVYPDNRTATLHLIKSAHWTWGATLHYKDSIHSLNLSITPRPNYATMIRAILETLPHNKSPVPQQETLQILSLIELANRNRQINHLTPIV